MSSKRSSQKKYLLWIIIFSHLLSVIVSAYYDRGIQITKYGNSVSFNEVRYWLWFFTWWSAWASLLTIPWAFYKLFIQKKENSYSEQLGDIIIAETNLISGILFCGGGFLLTYPSHPHTLISYPLLGQVKTIYIYVLYNIFWHILAPSLVFYYFWKYSQIDKLKKNLGLTLKANLVYPLIYFAYVYLRPLVSSYYPKSGSNKPHTYPRDYPYPFLFWSVGKAASRKEQESSSKWFFWHSWPKWTQTLFWFSTTLFLSFLGSFLLLRFLLKIKTYKEENLWKEI
jgi:hypothetical protein